MSRSRAPIRSAVLLSALLLAAGCDTDGPAFPDGETVVFAATLEPDQVSLQHLFNLTHNGTVRIVLSELSATHPDTGEPIPNPTLVLGLGRPMADDCDTRLTRVLAPATDFPVFLEVGQFCLETGRPLGLSVKSPVTYLITIQKAFS